MIPITQPLENPDMKRNMLPQPIVNQSQQKMEIIGNKEKKESKKKIRDPFTSSEDEMLKKLVDMYGTKQWRIIASMLPGRTPKQCRDRYTNYLTPGFFRGEWSNNEDMLLMKLFSMYGPKWSLLKKFFPNRSSNCIKNRWTYFLCRQYEEKKSIIDNMANVSIQNDEIQLFDQSKNDEMIFDQKISDIYSCYFNNDVSVANRSDDIMISSIEKAMSFIPPENDIIECYENAFNWDF